MMSPAHLAGRNSPTAEFKGDGPVLQTEIDRNGFERPTSRAPGFPAILEVILGFRETARW